MNEEHGTTRLLVLAITHSPGIDLHGAILIPNEDQRKFAECLADPNLADNEKLLRIAARVPNPEETLLPICEFAELIKEDLETKEALKLFYEDELSSTKWLLYACGALNAPQPGATARASA